MNRLRAAILLTLLLLCGCTSPRTKNASQPEPPSTYPYIRLDGVYYIAIDTYVKELPKGYEWSGTLNTENLYSAERLGLKYFTSKTMPELVYLYEACNPQGTTYDEVWGYTPWMRQDVYTPESLNLSEQPSLIVHALDQKQFCKPKFYPTGYDYLEDNLPVLQLSESDTLCFLSVPEQSSITICLNGKESTIFPQEDGTFRMQIDPPEPMERSEYILQISYYDGSYWMKLQHIPVYSWGITMTAADVTPTGLTLTITQSGGSVSGEFITGSWYQLDTLTSDGWHELPLLLDVAWTDEGYPIEPNGSRQYSHDWTSLYGKLPPGIYRICKSISLSRSPGDYDQLHFFAEFTIPRS